MGRPQTLNAEAVLRALSDFGFQAAGISAEDILSGKIIQLGVAPVRIDIISDLSGVSADEIWETKILGRLGPHAVHFIGKETFIKNKRASGRLKDQADLAALGEDPK